MFYPTGTVPTTKSHMFRTKFSLHDDIIKWEHFPRNWPFVREIHRSPVNSTHKDQWYVALMYSLIFAWTKRWPNNGDAGDLRRRRAHYDVTVIVLCDFVSPSIIRSLNDDCKSGIRDFKTLGLLFHWGRVNYAITGSDNKLYQSVIRTNAGLLLIEPTWNTV